MQITFDPAKEAVNVHKHGVSLALARDLEWDWLLAGPDTRQDYGEARIFCVVFVDRGGERRIISLRKANDREVKRYASQI